MAAKANKQAGQRIALCGILVSLMLVLGYIERLLPVSTLISGGIPGIKLGLANGVLVFAIYMLDDKTSWLLMLVKVVLSGVLFGNLEVMTYSLAGGVLSVLGMTLLHRAKGFSVIGISIAGGVLHNVGQAAMAILKLRTPQLVGYMYVLMLMGLATGAVTGFMAKMVLRHLSKMKI